MRLLEDWATVSDTKDPESEDSAVADVATFELNPVLKITWDNMELAD